MIATGGISGSVLNFLNDIITARDLTEDGVLAIEPLRGFK